MVLLGWREEAYYRMDSWRGRWDTEGGGVLLNQAVLAEGGQLTDPAGFSKRIADLMVKSL